MTAAGRAAEDGPPLIHEGRDGWLFLLGGSNYVASLYDRDSGELSDRRLAAWRTLFEARVARCEALGVACAFIVVPEKLTIYGDRAEAPVDPALSPAARLAESLSGSAAAARYVDLAPSMLARRDAHDLYWRTDTHWTPEGCHLAYQELCARLGWRQEPGLLERPRRTFPARLDLGGQVAPQRWEEFRIHNFLRKSSRVWINRVTGFLEDAAFQEQIHVGARARFENPSASNDMRVLLFGDSFCGAGPDKLTAMLAETVRSLEFVWSSDIDWRYVKRSRPDVLIIQIAERFLRLLPRDRRRLWLFEARQWLRAQRIKRRATP